MLLNLSELHSLKISLKKFSHLLVTSQKCLSSWVHTICTSHFLHVRSSVALQHLMLQTDRMLIAWWWLWEVLLNSSDLWNIKRSFTERYSPSQSHMMTEQWESTVIILWLMKKRSLSTTIWSVSSASQNWTAKRNKQHTSSPRMFMTYECWLT